MQTVKQAAVTIGISPTMIYRLIRLKILSARKFGVNWGISDESIRRYVAAMGGRGVRKEKIGWPMGRKRGDSSKFPGVHWEGTKWVAMLRDVDGKRIYLGRYDSEKAAAEEWRLAMERRGIRWSQYKGVFPHGETKWLAGVSDHKQTIVPVGMFDDEEEAAREHDRVALKNGLDPALANFPA